MPSLPVKRLPPIHPGEVLRDLSGGSRTHGECPGRGFARALQPDWRDCKG